MTCWIFWRACWSCIQKVSAVKIFYYIGCLIALSLDSFVVRGNICSSATQMGRTVAFQWQPWLQRSHNFTLHVKCLFVLQSVNLLALRGGSPQTKRMILFSLYDVNFCFLFTLSFYLSINNNNKKKTSQSVGFEPTLPEGIWFLVRRLNHSATTARSNIVLLISCHMSFWCAAA